MVIKVFCNRQVRQRRVVFYNYIQNEGNYIMKKIFTISFVSLFIFSCDEDNPISNNFEDYSYPLDLGNFWVYQGDYVIESYSDSLDNYFSSYGIIDTILVDSIYSQGDSLYNNIYRLKTINSTDPSSIGYQYMSNNDNGFYHHGYENPNTTILPMTSSNKFKLKGYSFSLDELINFMTYGNRDIIWEDYPLFSIEYPIENNNQWTYRDSIPWRMDRVVTQLSDSQFTIETLYDIDGDSLWDQNIYRSSKYSTQGVIEYTVIIDSLMIMDEVGNEFYYGRSTLNYHLIDHNISN